MPKNGKTTITKTTPLDGSEWENDPDRLLNLHDLDALGVMAEGTTRNRIAADSFPFPFVRIGSNVRFRLADVRAFIAAQRVNQ